MEWSEKKIMKRREKRILAMKYIDVWPNRWKIQYSSSENKKRGESKQGATESVDNWEWMKEQDEIGMGKREKGGGRERERERERERGRDRESEWRTEKEREKERGDVC